jgi:hypothetical protein
MSIKLHSGSMLLSLSAVVCGVIAVCYFTFPSWEASSSAFMWGVGIFVCIFLLFQYVIPARCPRCGQRARLEMAGTYKYRCSGCDYVHDTGFSSNAD